MMKISVESTGNSSMPTVLVSYFKSLVKYERSDESITKQDILDTYVVVSDIIAYNIANNEKFIKYYETSFKRILKTCFAPYVHVMT